MKTQKKEMIFVCCCSVADWWNELNNSRWLIPMCLSCAGILPASTQRNACGSSLYFFFFQSLPSSTPVANLFNTPRVWRYHHQIFLFFSFLFFFLACSFHFGFFFLQQLMPSKRHFRLQYESLLTLHISAAPPSFFFVLCDYNNSALVNEWTSFVRLFEIRTVLDKLMAKFICFNPLKDREISFLIYDTPSQKMINSHEGRLCVWPSLNSLTFKRHF